MPWLPAYATNKSTQRKPKKNRSNDLAKPLQRPYQVSYHANWRNEELVIMWPAED